MTCNNPCINLPAENLPGRGCWKLAESNFRFRYYRIPLQDAILEALLRDVPHHNAVRLALERQREQQGSEPPVAIVLPAHVRDRDAPVRPHALETYDQLKDHGDEADANTASIHDEHCDD